MRKDKKPYRILIIEDNPGDFVIVEDLLSESLLNPEIIHAVNYREAAAILAVDKSFTVILMDLSLPDKNGQDLVSEILKVSPTCCPVIVLTGYTDIEFSIKSLSQGIYDYLQKDNLTAEALYKSIIYSIERMKSRQEIMASEKRYSDLFHFSPQPTWVFEEDTFRFVQVNKAALDLYGYSKEEFLKMSIPDINPNENIADLKKRMNREIPEGEVLKNTVHHRKKSGEIIEMEIYANPITIDGKKFRTVIAIDVTQRNLHENNITKAIIKTQEDERYEIGSELHDNVCQLLAAANMSLGLIKKNIPAADIIFYDQGREYINLALEEIRNLSHRLAPAFFDKVSLKDAFRKLCKTFDSSDTYKIVLQVDDNIAKYKISRDIQLNSYRILQEQLSNIFKYSHATVITVNLWIERECLKMMVSDNGVGFDASQGSTGIGLANMKRRAELFSGKMEIISSPGKGCIVTIDIPLDKTDTTGSIREYYD